MSNVIRALQTNGYNQEEAYFHKKDQELLEAMREAAKANGDIKPAEAKVIDMKAWKAQASPPSTSEATFPLKKTG